MARARGGVGEQGGPTDRGRLAVAALVITGATAFGAFGGAGLTDRASAPGQTDGGGGSTSGGGTGTDGSSGSGGGGDGASSGSGGTADDSSSGSGDSTGDDDPRPTGGGGAPAARETSCPDDVPASPAGGEVRCFVVPDPGADVDQVAVPGFDAPLPVPVPIVVPIVDDTGDSGSTRVDQDVVVYVDIDNGQVVSGDPSGGRIDQRVLATIALLFLVPAWAAAAALLLRHRRDRRPPPPPPPSDWRPTWDPPAPPNQPPGGWGQRPPGWTPPGAPEPPP